MLDTPLAGPICPTCWSQVRTVSHPLCRICGDALPSWRIISPSLERCPRCRRRRGAVDAARAAGHYEGALRGILHAFKYEGRRGLAAPLADMIRGVGNDLLCDADAVVPVPLHPWRRIRRGFNQADELARRLGVPALRVLYRTRATRPQTGLSAGARRQNVRRAFALSPFVPQARTRIEGSTVVLIDDVRTTGATLEACALTLKAAGAREVRALTVARATPPTATLAGPAPTPHPPATDR